MSLLGGDRWKGPTLVGGHCSPRTCGHPCLSLEGVTAQGGQDALWLGGSCLHPLTWRGFGSEVFAGVSARSSRPALVGLPAGRCSTVRPPSIPGPRHSLGQSVRNPPARLAGAGAAGGARAWSARPEDCSPGVFMHLWTLVLLLNAASLLMPGPLVLSQGQALIAAPSQPPPPAL